MARQANNNASMPFNYIEGSDSYDAVDVAATQSYFVNHIGLMVSNITASREWYTKVLGMRHVFTFELANKFNVMYMAHTQGGRNGTGFQEGKELVRDKNNLAGLIEFMEYIPTASEKKFTPTPANTFSHLGLIVPDLTAAQKRFDELGVTILKRAGELDFSPEKEENQVFAKAWGMNDLADKETQENIKAMLPGLDVMGFKEFIIIADPDGNLFEVQALVPKGI